MSDLVSTRVNGSMVASFAGRDVRLVGKVVQQQNGAAVIEASDGAMVHVLGANIPFETPFVEVIGRAQPNGAVLQHAYSPWGHVFDLKAYDGLVRLSAKLAAAS